MLFCNFVHLEERKIQHNLHILTKFKKKHTLELTYNINVLEGLGGIRRMNW